MKDYFDFQIKSMESKIRKIEKEISKLPAGELNVYVNRKKYYRWYKIDGDSKIYIPREKAELARKLAHKKKLILEKENLTAKVQGFRSYKEITEHPAKELADFYDNNGYLSLLGEDEESSDEEINKWINSPFNSNKKHPDQLSFSCPSGNLVRSKSEVFIDMALNQHGIPYRYECELVLENKSFYPDFTIMHPMTKELIYWEHLGMMDDQTYLKNAYSKLSFYADYDIYPGKNLILTFETRANPFSFSDAEAALGQLHL